MESTRFNLRHSSKIAKMIENAAAVKVSAGTGGLAFEIQQAAQAAARQAGRPELAEHIKDLSPAAIAELIRENVSSQIIVGQGLEPNTFTLPTEEQLTAVRELEKKGLLEFGPESFDEFNSSSNSCP